MDEIIREIINIDKEATRKLREAEQKKEEIVDRQIEQENRELREKMKERAEQRLSLVRQAEQEDADQKISLITEEKEKKLESMKESFEQLRGPLAEEIFERVIGR